MVSSTRSFRALGFAFLFFTLATPPTHAQTSQPKELGTVDENPPIEILLGKTPELGFLLVSGHGVLLAQVVVSPTSHPDKVKAKIVSFTRLWKDRKKPDYEHRMSPQVKKVPFDDENDVTWSLLDGKEWDLGDEFLILKKNLRDRAEAVPEYKADGRYWFQKIGAANAKDGIDKFMKLVELGTLTK